MINSESATLHCVFFQVKACITPILAKYSILLRQKSFTKYFNTELVLPFSNVLQTFCNTNSASQHLRILQLFMNPDWYQIASIQLITDRCIYWNHQSQFLGYKLYRQSISLYYPSLADSWICKTSIIHCRKPKNSGIWWSSNIDYMSLFCEYIHLTSLPTFAYSQLLLKTCYKKGKDNFHSKRNNYYLNKLWSCRLDRDA